MRNVTLDGKSSREGLGCVNVRSRVSEGVGEVTGIEGARRGVGMARLAQAKVARRESEPKYIAGGRMQLKRMWEAGYTDESR